MKPKMRVKIICIWLFSFVVYMVAAQGIDTLELTKADIDRIDADRTLAPLQNRNGWVNPEDLASMPQCVAQQNTSIWLKVMTQCVRRQCTRRFGFCTHYQWLIKLSCLHSGFSPDIVRNYLSNCNKSVLAKAQLFQWIHGITGRTWLVEIGDAIELQPLKPAALVQGYAAVEVMDKAPSCLIDSVSVTSEESYKHAMAICGFTASSQHNGNAARPWEYNESGRSLVALDFATAGYDLTQSMIANGTYFDKHCFCQAFEIDYAAEPCSATKLASTKERLWMAATCGHGTMPGNWTDGLQTTKFDYVSANDWRWPSCMEDIPEDVIHLSEKCMTDACELDSDGYCSVERAVDRTCFCRNIDYNTCNGSCHELEHRPDYVNWLHDLCDNVEGWHGLPTHWRKLALLGLQDMIPWRWRVKPSRDSTLTFDDDTESPKASETCPSTDWKFASLVIVATATLSAGFLARYRYLKYLSPTSWLARGFVTTFIYLFANWVNAALVQSTPDYDFIPIFQLILFWCTIPRLPWPTAILAIAEPLEATELSPIFSYLFTEAILQLLSATTMLTTVQYGLQHKFYSSKERISQLPLPAQLMYAGALAWLIILTVSLILLIQTTRHTQSATPTTKTPQELIALFNHLWTALEENISANWMNKTSDPDQEQAPLVTSQDQTPPTYGTLTVQRTSSRNVSRTRLVVRFYLVTILCITFLSLAQFLFWLGFIGLMGNEYCPPSLGILTIIWVLRSLVVGAVASGHVLGRLDTEVKVAQ
ncbi:hypothetical protein LEMA_P098440.1 [Plenodomus lingam JN3]|uniref:Extracellular membrane protein CFEM domain-containing protein n=1 Tax=Leptosphaeria maculans (strain JN3 / isolate v23.1.3 / race Av1-4-5-6-7-8) TaxID=985895 RepID=E5A490_LEPMJ|nr:hypothetical protein LEMA_P098440.1 [Plenodomus lingam JN3]CBX98435.1 hypothetical protein LEMA_P098440.1 [Plenodomus lingam JN3]